MNQHIENIKYIESELKNEHHNKIFIANIFLCSLIELKKIASAHDINIDELTVSEIVDYVKLT